MIVRIQGKIIEKKENAVVVCVSGIFYELMMPTSSIQRLSTIAQENDEVVLYTYQYWQLTPSSGTAHLFGFLNAMEKDFFLQFISVAGIGPKAAIRAFDQSISDIAQAINQGDMGFLKKLPGIGQQRAKDIIAKLQGKVGKFCLIQDQGIKQMKEEQQSLQQEALLVLMQLQYKKSEAQNMIERALKMNPSMVTVEELLNTIYQQKAVV